MRRKPLIVLTTAVVGVLVVMLIMYVSSVNADKTTANSIKNSREAAVLICENYGMKSPQLEITNKKIDKTLWIEIVLEDPRFEEIENEKKFDFATEFFNLKITDHAIIDSKIEISKKPDTKRDIYSLDFENKNILLLNGTSIYEHLTEEEKLYRQKISTELPQLHMSEKDLFYTKLGKPDKIEKSLDFDVKVPRARHKTYYWVKENFQVDVWYSESTDGTVYGRVDYPENDGFVFSYCYTDANGYIHVVDIND